MQRVVIFGDMGKVESAGISYFLTHVCVCMSALAFERASFTLQDEADGSNEYNNFQYGSLNTTKQLIKDLKNIDMIFHIGDICYANGYISQWDQFTSQVEPIASRVPYMIARYF